MKKRFWILFSIFVLSGIFLSHAHESESTDFFSNKWLPIVSIALGVISVIYTNIKLKKEFNKKTIIFSFIVFAVISITSYLAIQTIYNNITSFSQGPVHWHADYEVWTCGELINLQDPKSLISNKIGTPEIHEHNDNRIHIEGLIKRREDVLLGAFFEDTGGGLTHTSISVPIHDEGPKTWSNGDLCNNKTGKLYMFVNGNVNDDFEEYLIAPYPDVPPGDRIKFVFTEKPLNEINKELGSEP
ncbi:hypothetical protein HYX18_02985 [Candidatus Woesearchaeota archaeon]|nr:hypothetical protein [Candidatus Woesearchaeota archaeon]